MIKHKTEGAITMATKKDVHDLFLNHVNSNAVKRRKMMGEYIIYYDGVVIVVCMIIDYWSRRLKVPSRNCKIIH